MPRGKPEEVSQRLIEEAGETESERAANVSVAQAEGEAPLPERATGAKATLQRLARPVENQRKWSTALVATVTLAVGVVTAVAATAIISQLKRAGIDAQSRGASVRKEQAAALRHSATDACRDHRWGECRRGLDDARALDPPGEGTPEVKALRKAIDDATAPPK